MITIETRATVTPDGKLSLQAPVALEAGDDQVVLVIDEKSEAAKALLPLNLHILSLKGWPPNATFRRDDLYGDDGR